MSPNALASLMQVLGDCYGREVSESQVATYGAALADLSDEQVETAARWAMRECAMWPSPAQLWENSGRQPRGERYIPDADETYRLYIEPAVRARAQLEARVKQALAPGDAGSVAA